MCALDLDKAAKYWKHQLDVANKLAGSTDLLALQAFVEKVTIFLKAIEPNSQLDPEIADIFGEYAKLLASQGLLTAAAMYIDVDNEIWETPLSDSLRAERYAEINDDLSYRYKLAQLKEQFAQERGNTLFDQRVVDIEMDVYWDMARVWPHAVRDLNLTMITQPLDIPDRKNYIFPVGVKSPDSSFTDVAQTHIWELVIRSGDWLDGIRVRHDGGITSGFHGQLSGQGTVVYLEDDEYINGITGRASNRVFQFVMETTTGRTLQFPFTDPLGRGEPFWTGIPIAPRLGRQVLLAVHGGGESSTQINQLYFEFGPVPGQSLANTTSLKPSNQK